MLGAARGVFLKDYAYFTYAKINGPQQKGAFGAPIEYWAEYDPKESVLTLHFTLPFKKLIKAKSREVDVYNPEFLIDFGFAKAAAARRTGVAVQVQKSGRGSISFAADAHGRFWPKASLRGGAANRPLSERSGHQPNF